MKSSLIGLLFVALIPLHGFAKGSAVADVALTPAGDFKAKTEDVNGFAVLKGDTVTAQNVVVDLRNLKTGLDMRDKHARDKYMEVQKYPTMTLVKGEGKGGKGKGLISWRGVQKEVQGTYKVNGDSVAAEFPLKLSDFKITGIRYMGVGVDDEITVHVTVPLKK